MDQNRPSPKQDAGASFRSRRLLADIKELVAKPYPNIQLHVNEDDLSRACLILNPANYKPLHLTVTFRHNYPIGPPKIQMDSSVQHPNVFDGYICASIPNTEEGYTPAYTLKGIAIQMLSFFSSDSVEQSYGGNTSLAGFKATDRSLYDSFQCQQCGFNSSQPSPKKQPRQQAQFNALVDSEPGLWPTLSSARAPRKRKQGAKRTEPASSLRGTPVLGKEVKTCEIGRLPNEVLLLVIENMDFEELTSFAAAWPRISQIVADFDVVRQRELQCFCLKRNYLTVKLGVGVSVRRGHVASEFDLLSQEAFRHWRIRRSVNHIAFDHWLPLPISQQHWRRVRGDAAATLGAVRRGLRGGPSTDAQVLFAFMNDVVVRLNEVAAGAPDGGAARSTLRHASEKAIESYFHLFHLLVCLAAEDAALVAGANALLRSFAAGRRAKADCPNLGHLLVARLISDVEPSEELTKAIVVEAITRNVVWLLDRRGAGLAELAYLEADPVSHYRLARTFAGSRTSYRLLMFAELFRRTARPASSASGGAAGLARVRDELFARHGAPPRGAAARLAAEVRRLHEVSDFPAFLREMGLAQVPSAERFTEVLRDTVRASMEKGYSRWGVAPEMALVLRAQKDPGLAMTPEMHAVVKNLRVAGVNPNRSFFPNGDR
ncbi:hypothetical protein GGS23DRAFT_613162 [Durotheca rogersii]|uniref:uncharacterized protein n=1 Tax=Durotheca rogersii TaxID=419775 RepID=UPI002220455A|nr:uncharacterized protein GGS23DRAFT_613162 [Durotheca rogersii]KAI5861016.1 hypothetical protein GGS23DRAFT_613162 [Durotheca rogersii]